MNVTLIVELYYKSGQKIVCYTSANQTVYLYDGSILQITSAFVKDRTNNIYKNFPISPDIQTNNAKSSAIEWIKSQIK